MRWGPAPGLACSEGLWIKRCFRPECAPPGDLVEKVPEMTAALADVASK